MSNITIQPSTIRIAHYIVHHRDFDKDKTYQEAYDSAKRILDSKEEWDEVVAFAREPMIVRLFIDEGPKACAICWRYRKTIKA